MVALADPRTDSRLSRFSSSRSSRRERFAFRAARAREVKSAMALYRTRVSSTGPHLPCFLKCIRGSFLVLRVERTLASTARTSQAHSPLAAQSQPPGELSRCRRTQSREQRQTPCWARPCRLGTHQRCTSPGSSSARRSAGLQPCGPSTCESGLQR